LENLIFSLNATVPIFMMMILGMVLKKLKVINDSFASQMNKFVFLVPLPVLLFNDLATVNFQEVWDFRFVLFCVLATVFSILIACFLASFLKERSLRGEFIQASYRSSAALLGIALIQNIYGTSVMGPLMIIGSVPLYNIMAVTVLSYFQPAGTKSNQGVWKKTLKGIATNPIILGIVVGTVWSLLQIPLPPILSKTVSHIASMATPMGVIAMGASFDTKKALGRVKPTLVATFMKLIGYCLIFLPIAVMLGFVKEQLVAILIMLGSATTVTCFVMAKNMGHEGVLSSSVVMLTTLLSGFTITFWLFILRSFGLI